MPVYYYICVKRVFFLPPLYSLKKGIYFLSRVISYYQGKHSDQNKILA